MKRSTFGGFFKKVIMKNKYFKAETYTIPLRYEGMICQSGGGASATVPDIESGGGDPDPGRPPRPSKKIFD